MLFILFEDEDNGGGGGWVPMTIITRCVRGRIVVDDDDERILKRPSTISDLMEEAKGPNMLVTEAVPSAYAYPRGHLC